MHDLYIVGKLDEKMLRDVIEKSLENGKFHLYVRTQGGNTNIAMAICDILADRVELITVIDEISSAGLLLLELSERIEWIGEVVIHLHRVEWESQTMTLEKDVNVMQNAYGAVREYANRYMRVVRSVLNFDWDGSTELELYMMQTGLVNHVVDNMAIVALTAIKQNPHCRILYGFPGTGKSYFSEYLRKRGVHVEDTDAYITADDAKDGSRLNGSAIILKAAASLMNATQPSILISNSSVIRRFGADWNFLLREIPAPDYHDDSWKARFKVTAPGQWLDWLVTARQEFIASRKCCVEVRGCEGDSITSYMEGSIWVRYQI